VTGYKGDRQYQCVLEKIESNAVICKIEGQSEVDTLDVSLNIKYICLYAKFLN